MLQVAAEANKPNSFAQLKFSPDGKIMVGVVGSNIYQIDAYKGNPQFTHNTGIPEGATPLQGCFSPDNRFLLSGKLASPPPLFVTFELTFSQLLSVSSVTKIAAWGADAADWSFPQDYTLISAGVYRLCRSSLILELNLGGTVRGHRLYMVLNSISEGVAKSCKRVSAPNSAFCSQVHPFPTLGKQESGQNLLS